MENTFLNTNWDWCKSKLEVQRQLILEILLKNESLKHKCAKISPLFHRFEDKVLSDELS